MICCTVIGKGAFTRMQCQVCNQETNLPFRCPYCGGQLCSVHRLQRAIAAQEFNMPALNDKIKSYAARAYNSYQYSYNFGQQPFQRKRHITSSPTEIRHLSVLAAFIIATGFSIGLYANYFGGFGFTWTLHIDGCFRGYLTSSVLAHEFAHKVMAQRSGMWAEFRLTTWGVVLTAVSVFLPIRMIAPGAMMIAGSPNGDDIVKISLAGPLTNLILSVGILGSCICLVPNYLCF